MSHRSLSIIVTTEDTPQRLDSFIASKTGLTRSQTQKMIASGLIRVNDLPSTKDYKVKAEDQVFVQIEDKGETTLLPESIPLRFHFSDDYIAVVDKPSNMVVYPSAGHQRGTLINGIYYHCKKTASIGLPLRPGIVHRLDKDTSGVMVVALDDAAYYNLVEQFRRRGINRRYLAIVYGSPKMDYGDVSLSIGRSESNRKKMSVKTRRGKDAMTSWRVLRRYDKASLIELRLGTGRTHQIRVHMTALGHPVLGDSVYGSKLYIDKGNIKIPVKRQMLHAETLGFVHPYTGQYIEFHSEMPEDMIDCLRVLSE